MIKKFTFIFLCLTASICKAGTPIIDGVYSSTEGWGPALSVSDGIAGWQGANARTLYYTQDANYYYLAAEANAASWMQFAFLVNNKAGGGANDSWSRQINYMHANLPDYVFRGDIAGTNYSEYHTWNGIGWSGLGSNINVAGTEVKGTGFGGSLPNPTLGFIEIRIPRSFITPASSIGDIQFIITGNNNDHGNFDAIPADNNSTGWNPPASTTNVSQYVNNVPLNNRFVKFTAQKVNDIAKLNWQINCTVSNVTFEIEKSINGRSYSKIGELVTTGLDCSKPQTFADNTYLNNPKTYYRIKVIERAGNIYYSNIQIVFNEKGGFDLGSLIPTVVDNRATLTLSSAQATKATIYIANNLGSIVHSQVVSAQSGTIIIPLQVQNLSSGTYQVYAVSDAGKTKAIRFIKN